MTYIAKLTKRIVMGRSVALLLALSSLSACGAETALAPTREAVDEIAMSADSVRLVAGAGIRLSAEVRVPRGRAQDQTVEWQSSDTTVATVDESGLVMTYTEGTTEIRATKRGKTGKTTVVVVAVPVAKVVVTPSSTGIEVGRTTQLVATTLSSTDSVLTGRAVGWASDAPAVATVSGTGVVTAVGSGTARITATSEGVSGVATVSVASAQAQPVPSGGSSMPFFADNFDSGTKTNANGFSWSSSGSRVTVSAERAFSGTHALRFRFGPDTLGGDSSAEQRFTLTENLAEIWIEYMLFVPTNYFHRTDSPANNKFIRLWGDSYSAANKVGASTMPALSGASTIAFEYNYESWGDGTLGFGPSGVSGARSPSSGFAGESMRGKWTRVRIHARHVSGANTRDGVLRMWLDGELAVSFLNVPQKYDSARPYWNAGYLLGWANSGYATETVLFIDDVKLYGVNPGW